MGKVRISTCVGPTSEAELLSFTQLQVIVTPLFTGPSGSMIVWKGQFHKALTLPNIEMPGSLLCVRTSLVGGSIYWGNRSLVVDFKSPFC